MGLLGDIVDNLTTREVKRMARPICCILLATIPLAVVARQHDLPHFDPQTTKVAFVMRAGTIYKRSEGSAAKAQ